MFLIRKWIIVNCFYISTFDFCKFCNNSNPNKYTYICESCPDYIEKWVDEIINHSAVVNLYFYIFHL